MGASFFMPDAEGELVRLSFVGEGRRVGGCGVEGLMYQYSVLRRPKREQISTSMLHTRALQENLYFLSFFFFFGHGKAGGGGRCFVTCSFSGGRGR